MLITPPTGDRAVCLSSPDCVKVLDTAGCVVTFNDDGLRVMEIDALSSVVGRYWPDFWPEDWREAAREALEGARRVGVASFSSFCPTAKGTPKWWDVTIAAVPGMVAQFVVISRDVTAARMAERAEGANVARLRAIVGSNSDVLWDIDLQTGTVWWSEGLQALFGYGADQIGDSTQWCHAHIHPEDRRRVVQSMELAVADGSATWEADFRYRTAAGDYLDVFDRGAILRDADGAARHFVGIMQDVTSRNAATAMHKLVAGELAHRVSNTLAVVSSLFHQSVRNSADLPALGEAFGRRLAALAAANTAILRGTGNGADLGADLGEIARAQLGPYLESGRLRIDGPRTCLDERVSVALSLAFNELATNALKYGALSGDGGGVALTWDRVEGDRIEGDRIEERRLRLAWVERGGPAVRAPTRRGLGSKLIEGGIPRARVERRFDPEGFSCVIELAV